MKIDIIITKVNLNFYNFIINKVVYYDKAKIDSEML